MELPGMELPVFRPAVAQPSDLKVGRSIHE
jgi:hypothetical protein